MSKRKNRKRRKTSQSSEEPKLLDIIVPFFGEYRLMAEAMSAISEAIGDIPHNIYIVDNGTNDGKSKIYLKSLGLGKVIALSKNAGYPGAVNRGTKAGVAPLVVVYSADVVMEPGSLALMVKKMDDPEIGVVGCKLIFPKDGSSPHGPAGTIQHAGITVNIGAKPFHIHMGWPNDAKKPNTSKEMQFVTGAVFMFRRNLFRKIGGFNEEYGHGTYEDMEFCMRTKELGKKVFYLAEAQGSHYVGGSIKEGVQEEGFSLVGNEQRFINKFRATLEWDEWRYW